MHIDSNLSKSNDKLIVVAVDMQKSIPIPQLSVKESHYGNKITVYNQTFCGISKDEQSICIVSNDTQIEKTSKEFVNFILQFLKSGYCKKTKKISFLV
jgi:hypothetical protein